MPFPGQDVEPGRAVLALPPDAADAQRESNLDYVLMRDAPPPRLTRRYSAAAKRSVPAGPVAHREHLEVEVAVRHVVHRPLGQREPDELARVGVLVADGALVLGAVVKTRRKTDALAFAFMAAVFGSLSLLFSRPSLPSTGARTASRPPLPVPP